RTPSAMPPGWLRVPGVVGMQKELTQAKLMPILPLSSRSSASSTAHNSEVTTMEGEG
ncbi:MAG: hypothetical protein SGPRY_013749, partial [Prymnesium sp.]